MELVCRASRAADFARLATVWMTEARSELFPDEPLAAEPAASGPAENAPDAPWGPPDGLHAQLLLQPGPRASRTKSPRYSPRNFRRVLSSLADDPPFRMYLLLHPLDSRGHPVDDEKAVSIEFHRLPEDPQWVRFAVSAPASLVPWPDSADLQRRWVECFARWAVRLDAVHGHLTDDAGTVFGTALERVLNLWLEQTVPASGETLRSYSWVTLCSADIAERLGGPRVLRASGAFHEVRELPGGRLLLQATPRLEQYTGPAPAKVLRALAPALPRGRTDSEYLLPGARLVPDVDAADFTPGS